MASKGGDNSKIGPKAAMTVSEAGRLGGLETLRRHGRQHFAVAGRRGQTVMAQHYSTEARRLWGALGGRPRRGRSDETGEKE